MNPLYAVVIWFAFATVVGLLPRRFHPYGAYILLLTLFPLCVIVFRDSGLVLMLILIIGAASVLRYPFMYMGKRWGRKLGLIKGEET